MAAYSGAFGLKSGFNQSGGSYYITLSTITGEAKTYTPGSGSGGAATVGTFAAYSFPIAGDALQSTLLTGSKVIKDMGKTVVSAGRSFRKFQAVETRAASSTFGVVGSAASTTNPGYLSFYLEVGNPSLGPNGASIAPIARY